MNHGLKRPVIAAGLALCCTVGFGSAQAANLVATENGDVATFLSSQFDTTAFTFTSNGESANGSGAFLANATATGSALVVLTEGPNGANSDWLELIYSGSGGRGTETITAHWNSDDDAGGLPALPTGVTPVFLAETGGFQNVTAQLGASAIASGFNFPSNITIAARSDAAEPAVPEPSTWAMMIVGFAGLGYVAFRSGRKESLSRSMA